MSTLIKTSLATRTPVADLLRRVPLIIHGAVPPAAIDADLSFVADDVDVSLIDALRFSDCAAARRRPGLLPGQAGRSHPSSPARTSTLNYRAGASR